MTEKNSSYRESDSATITKTRKRVKKPPLYKVFLINDDYTTMEFVVHVLQKFFQKSFEEATQIMLTVHQQGKGICGCYPKEIAETKSVQVVSYAQKNDFPLQCSFEEA